MKKAAALFLCFLLVVLFAVPAFSLEYHDTSDAVSVLLMEAKTGTVLFEKNADQPLPPASVTKVMTILLILEAIDAGKINTADTVTVSDYAAGMGGSQVYLKAGETMTVDELLKSVVVASANDAAVALAEYLCGSEASFVARMNERAGELGMKNTVFKNTNGLDDSDEGHLTSARDIALMSREVLKHELIFRYSTIWMDSIRNGAFGLTNTNRLIRFYPGANGLKTGSTQKAGFCISATAMRDELQLIAVIMGASSRDGRNACAVSLFDYGFANYTYCRFAGGNPDPIPIRGGETSCLCAEYAPFEIVLEKGKEKDVRSEITLQTDLHAPICTGDCVGTVTYSTADGVIGEVPVIACEEIKAITFGGILRQMLGKVTAFS